ncbi:MAG: recombinase family protein [Oscillospiraceae bacterium]|nr:recombinase family protein [Oscillospiraceae bacterium]
MIKKYLNYDKLVKKAKEEHPIQEKLSASYRRCSTFGQITNSLGYQDDEINSYAEEKGYKIIKEYIDGGKTAKYADTRDSFMQIMEDVKNGVEWEYLLVYDDSRFVRNTGDGDTYESFLNEHGIKLVSITEEFGDDPDSKYLKKMKRANNEHYLDALQKVTRDGLMHKARESSHCGGIAPLGYDLKKKKLVINPYEAAIVQRIFNMYENNVSYAKMAEILNNDGCRTKTGNKFGKNSFNSILQQPKYTGLYTYNVREAKGSKGKRNNSREKPIEEHIINPGGVPQIITEAQFDRVKKKMEKRAAGKDEPKTRYHYVLGSKKILKCAKCGALMCGTTQSSHGKKYRTYRCPNHKKGLCETKEIRADRLEKFVIYNLVSAIFENENPAELNKVFNDSVDENIIKEKIEKANTAIKNISKALRKQCSDTLLVQLAELEEEKVGLEERLEKHEAQKIEINQQNISRVKRAVARYLKDSYDLEATNLIKTAVKNIFVSNDGVKMELAV